MRFLEEIVVEEFLPTVRSMLAEELREQGLTQQEVADFLGISQSAVSKYAHGSVDRNARIAEDERVGDLVERIATRAVDDEMSPTEALIELEVLIRELEGGGLLATLHHEAMPELETHPELEAIHDPSSRVRERERILSALRRAIRRLERTAGFAALIPQVGSNLVYARDDATSIDDVAGIPGRIVNVKGRATVPAGPEFGVSEHVASVVLAARRGGSEHRAAINLIFDPDLMHRLEVAGYRSAEIEPGARLEDAVAEAVHRAPDTMVVYHEDAPGIEANTYLLGQNPNDVVETVRSMTDTDATR